MSKFEEEYKRVSDTNIRLVCEYLMSRSDMRVKLDDPKKSIYKMWDFIISQAKKKANESKNKYVACSDDEVYGWAVHYYDEEVVEEDAEQSERLNLESAKAIVKKSVEKKKKSKKEESEWVQESLF